MNFQIFKLDLEKAEDQELKLPTSTGSSKKAREFQKNIYFCFIDYTKAFYCEDHNKLENSSKDGNTRPPDLPPEKNSRLVPNREQEYVKAVYCHPAYLTYMQSTS